MLMVCPFQFSQIPLDQGWVLDGFPMTLNQAKLLEEALTGYDRNLIELEEKKKQISTLAVDPTASKEVPPPPSAFDFVMLLDISDNSSLDRMNDIMGKLDTFSFCCYSCLQFRVVYLFFD